jgi:hypothetical protein
VSQSAPESSTRIPPSAPVVLCAGRWQFPAFWRTKATYAADGNPGTPAVTVDVVELFAADVPAR